MMNNFHKLTVSEIKKLTETSVEITFTVPDLLKKVFSYEAGQYLTIQQEIDNQKVRRAYSICSGVDEGTLSVAVKRISGGIFSTYATTELKVGDVLEVMPPQGRFIFFPDLFGDRSIMLFSAGSGVTPMMSIAKTALAKTDVKVVFVYGNKSREEILFFDEIEQLREKYPDRFLVHYVFSQQMWRENISGRINGEVIDFVFEKYKQLGKMRYYVCGPNGMVSDVKENILGRGIEQEDIFAEFFEITTPENDFSRLQGNVTITCIFGGEEKVFQSPKNQSLLEAVLSQGLDVPYSCQNGVCSSCMGRITDGEAKMAKNETLVDKEIAEGLTLTCQSYAITDRVTLSYDI